MSLENFLKDNLSLLMQSQDLNANKLSRITGIRATTIYKLKDGALFNPTFETLYPIAKHFGISIEELMNVKLCSPKQIRPAVGSIPLILLDEIDKFPNVDVERYVNTDFTDVANKFCIKIQEDGLKFEYGSILVIDTKSDYLSKDYVLLKKHGESHTSLKRVLYDDGFFFQSITIGLEHKVFDINEYQVLGVVIGYLKYFKAIDK